MTKGMDLCRARHDRVLRYLVCSFIFVVLGNVLSLSQCNKVVDSVTQPGVACLARNITTIVGLYSLVRVFHSGSNMRATPARAVFDLCWAAATCIGLIVFMAFTPTSLRSNTFFSTNMTEPGIYGFYILGNCYFIYAYSYCGKMSWCYASTAPRFQIAGLRLVAVGLMGSTITSFTRALWVVARAAHLTFPPIVNTLNFGIVNVCTTCIVAGLCFPAIAQALAATRSRISRRLNYHRLDTLWGLIAEEFPELILSRAGPASGFWKIRHQSIHARYYRRIIECRDGLVRLSPYLVAESSTDLTRCSAQELAVAITAALRRKPPVEDPDTAFEPRAVALPEGADFESESRILLAVSEALKTEAARMRAHTVHSSLSTYPPPLVS